MILKKIKFSCLVSIALLFLANGLVQAAITKEMAAHKFAKRDKPILVIVKNTQQSKPNSVFAQSAANLSIKSIRRPLKRVENHTAQLKIASQESMVSTSVMYHELQELLNDPTLQVFENRLHKPSLAQSVPLVFPNQATAGFNGNGQSVVLIDTGVNASHSFLSGRINDAASACFSNDGNSGNVIGGESLCLAMAGTSTGAGSGANCDQSITGCEHGTKMAGVIAGSNGSQKGVAVGATVIPIQVYTKITDDDECGGSGLAPCIGAFSSDILSAMNYINNTLRFNHTIAAINMSLSTSGLFQGNCDAEPLEPVAASLTSAGISIVASSGNNGSNTAMSSPACISHVISVAATSNADSPWAANNRNSALDLFAPGVGINSSSLPISSFASDSGTSIATAHVSAAIAVMRDAKPSASAAAIKQALKTSGPLITQGSAINKRRLNVTDSLVKLLPPPPPSDQATVVAPLLLLLHDD